LSDSLWERCLLRLQGELPAQQFNTWIRPLKADTNTGSLRLFAPNRFVLDWVNDKFLQRIREIVAESGQNSVELGVIPRQEAAFLGAMSNEAHQIPSRDVAPAAGAVQQSNTYRQFPENTRPVVRSESRERMFDSPEIGLDRDMVGDIPVAEQDVFGERDSESGSSGNRRLAREDVEGGLTHRNYLNTSFTSPILSRGSQTNWDSPLLPRLPKIPADPTTRYLFTVVWVWVKRT
jgi:chromosomal replication initiator protein